MEMVRDRKAWPAAVHGVPKSQTRMSGWTTANTWELAEEKSQIAVCYIGSSSTNKGLELCLVINFCPFWKTGEGENLQKCMSFHVCIHFWPCRVFVAASLCGISCFGTWSQWLQWKLSCPKACGILVPQAGIEPISPALEGRSHRRRAESFLISASSQLPSVLNKPCAEVSYFGVPYLVPFNSQQVCTGSPQVLGSWGVQHAK